MDYNGQIGYVSGRYLETEKPIPDIAETTKPQEMSEVAQTEAVTPEVTQPETPVGLVAINDLANKKSLKKNVPMKSFRPLMTLRFQS